MGLSRRALRAGGVGFFLWVALSAGCVGGQSGTEGLCPEGMVQRTDVPDGSTVDVFGSFGADEDGGVDTEIDATTAIANSPEGSDGPNQCIVPQD